MANTNSYIIHCRKATVVDGGTGKVIEEFDLPDHHPGHQFELGKPWRGDPNICVVRVDAEREPLRYWDNNRPFFIPTDPKVTITVLFTNIPRKWAYNAQMKGWVPSELR